MAATKWARAAVFTTVLAVAACQSNVVPTPPASSPSPAPSATQTPSAPPSATPTAETPAPSTATGTPAPTAAGTTPTPTATSATGAIVSKAPDDCEAFIFVPCPRQVSTLSMPIAGSSFSLTYASDRVPGRTVSPSIPSAPIGLGGWGLDVLASYDPTAHVLVIGSGERRVVDAIATTVDGADALVVPSTEGTTIYVFDPSGREIQAVDGVTGAALETFAWTDAGLSSITERGGRQTRVRRDASGAPIEIVSAGGYRTRLGVQGGWLAAVADPSGHVAHITSTSDGLVEVVRDPADARTVLRYDADGRLQSMVGPNGQTASFARTDQPDSFTVTTSTSAGLESSDTVALDGSRVVRTHVDAAGQTTSVTVDGAKRTITTSDGTSYQLSMTPDPRWGMASPVPAMQLTTASGRASSVSESRSATDPGSAVGPTANTRALTVNGATWTVAFDPGAKETTITGPDGQTRTTTFDDQGRPASVEIAGYPLVEYHYDDLGRIDTVTWGTGADARVWHYVFDRSDGTVAVTDPSGQTLTVSVDANGREIGITPATGAGTLVEHDAIGQVTAITPPGEGTTRTQTRTDGRADVVTLPAGSSGPRYTAFSYDEDGVVTGIGVADGTGVAIGRDRAGRVSSVDSGGEAVQVAYDPNTGGATTLSGPAGTLTRTFDGRALASEAWSGAVAATVSRRLDASGRVVGESVDGASDVTYAYDPTGRLTSAGDLSITRDPHSGLPVDEHLGSLDETFTYDAFGELTGETVSSGGQPIWSLEVARDAVGRVTSRTERMADGSTHSRSFSYDAQGRLASATDDGKAKTTYAYDAAGNLVRETPPKGPALTATYDDGGQLQTFGQESYAYDAAGRLATVTSPSGTSAYSYDRAGHLLSVTPAGKPAISFVVDPTGRRIGKTIGGQLVQAFAYSDGLRPAAQLGAGGGVVDRYVYSGIFGAPAYVQSGDRELLVVADDAGTPRVVIDAADGSVVDQIQTDPWGQLGSETQPGTIPFGFAGGLIDSDTGLLHFGARDYDPATGRWTAPDLMGSGSGELNPYRYAHDDPVDRVDPRGMCDVFTVGVSGSGFLPYGGGGSLTVGLVTGGTDIGGFGTVGTGIGIPGFGLTVEYTCMFENPPAPGTSTPGSPIDEFGGAGGSVDGSPGVVSGGGDQSYNDDGSASLTGGHGSVGFQTPGGSAQRTNTGVWCWTCPDKPDQPDAPDDTDPPPGDNLPDCPGGLCGPDKDAGPDQPDQQGMCDAGDCSPDDPNAAGPQSPSGSGGLDGPGSRGDPHLNTADHFYFDFMAAGEFTALQSDSGDMVVQVRQVPYADSRWISVNSAIAVGDAGDRLTFAFGHDAITLAVDGEPVAPVARFDLPHGGFILPEPRSYLVGWPDGSLIRVFRNVKGLDLSMQLASGRVGTVHGILGPYTGEKNPTVQAADGTVLTADEVKQYGKLYRVFGDSWRIDQTDSLFDYAPGQSTKTFDLRDFPDPNPPPIPPASEQAARDLCERAGVPEEALDGCAYDVAATGEAGFAVTTAQSTALGPPPVPSTPVPPTPGAQTFAIKVGDTVSQDVPGSGAGDIETPDAVDVYTFDGEAGDQIYLDSQGDCANAAISWTLLGPDNAQVLGLEGGTSTSVCLDLGAYTLPVEGAYSIRVSGATDASGSYRFQLWSVPVAQTFAIKVGDTVSQDVPGSGAGDIETPGAVDLYTFSGRAGDQVYVDAQGDCADAGIGWTLLDPTGGPVTKLDGSTNTSVCLDLGGYSLPVTGTYTLRVAGSNSQVGAYDFRVTAIPAAQTFAIKVGDTVSQGVPGSGAGEIETPGAVDLYTFSGASGDQIYLDAQGDCVDAGIGWTLLGPDGKPASTSDGRTDTSVCLDLGAYSLPAAGTYTLRVAGSSSQVGAYQFKLTAIPATQTFAIKVGDTVSQDVPSAGAGDIETPGAVDLYTFSGTAGDQIFLAANGDCADAGIGWQLLGPDGKPVSTVDGRTDTSICLDLGAYSLPATGTYTLRVAGSSSEVATYGFTLRRP